MSLNKLIGCNTRNYFKFIKKQAFDLMLTFRQQSLPKRQH